ncbi:PEP-CTERM sorting domain-containing protein [Amphiplicatus metriothermophilus]|uniref:PEP-CTERM protein-sorting domain-containing protein n=1 Tax=Amphiplicatus metriothermophilus TaxID=1519374 RepID=A0A239PLE0_9PROT|nr:PEP-CTERM sorting domain-containing protein [Amphiplicatus metriothermophilus]MBB5517522.1 hypothetical protein [Amphiplicatus metriothermophilus]SNT68143.1 PEP-CTERM protein-sorting domain-containing protein [Amphiplicatus metriothermophilus]
MSRRRLYAALAVFLFATLVVAPTAWFLGVFHSGREKAEAPPAYVGPPYVVEMSESVWDCHPFRGFSGLRANMNERACGPGGRGMRLHAGRDGPRLAGARRRGGPLQQAAVRSVAGDLLDGPHAGPDGFVAGAPTAPLGEPLSFALAPGGGLLGPGAAPGGPGLPRVLAPFGPFQPDEPPPELPPVPVPGALPLFLTGLAGFLAFARRRRR